jgi:predicted alpha-1,2-mannosidase
MRKILLLVSLALILVTNSIDSQNSKSPVDYVNPYMGNISHLLVPTDPIVHLPNSMLRVYPQRDIYTDDHIKGLPVMLTNNCGSFAFHFSPYSGNEADLKYVMQYSYDNEKTTPYHYQVLLDEVGINVDFAPSHQSALYEIKYGKAGTSFFVVGNDNGYLQVKKNIVSGYQNFDKARVYIYAEFDSQPIAEGALSSGKIDGNQNQLEGENIAVALSFGTKIKDLKVRYGISFISIEQARKNLQREIMDYNLANLVQKGRMAWNKALGKILVQGGTENDKAVFYTSLYRCYQRPINMSEDGCYYSGFDNKVHQDGGRPFYTDDWIWDTFRAAHPLRILIDKQKENDILYSFLLMAQQMGNGWIPTFPGTFGDRRLMNCNHTVASLLDAYRKGLRGFDLKQAYEYSRKAIEEKTLIPWSSEKAGWIEDFYKQHGYIPALLPGEKETLPNVSSWEKRQPVAVTLGTSYDEWCLSQIAKELGDKQDADHYLKCSYNYHHIFNPETRFFHPKDQNGNFIKNVDYKYTGRQYFCENNGYIHRWEVQHNVADLISLMGGREAFVSALDSLFSTPLGMSRWQFYGIMPDHGANVGMYSMANEPCFHIPYLYNYAGQPWKTQKRVRTLLKEWFRNDLMGVPGDEDGGGMSAFVVFSQMGFYPVTPGYPSYNIGSPVFKDAKIELGNGHIFEIRANGASDENKYIQSAKLNGKILNQVWFNHSDISEGGLLELEMGPLPNKNWGVQTPPPSQGPENN